MRPLPRFSLVVAALVMAGHAATAQNANALVGAWERISLKDSAGVAIQPPTPPAFLIFTTDGFYSQTAFPVGRPQLTKNLSDYTKEELLSRYTRAEARRGRYTVSANTLTRTYLSSLNPNDEGGPPQVQLFRIDGDVLILTSTTPTSMSEARFRRAK